MNERRIPGMTWLNPLALLPLLTFFGSSAGGAEEKAVVKTEKQPESVYDFTVEDASGKPVSLDGYRGKVLLIVNTASKCGFTKQYAGLEKLYQLLKEKDFVILGFPCNQFGGQEPGSDQEIQDFCQLNYGVSFPVFGKIKVNGEEAHPLYKYLQQQLPGLAGSERIKWNFTKFLVDRKGKVVGRYASAVKPEELRSKIEPLL